MNLLLDLSTELQIIIALLVLLCLCAIKILQLYRLLSLERKRRIVPSLTIEIKPEEDGLILCNDGYCPAKDITIEDLPLMLDLDFQKKLTLKFFPQDILGPNETAPLDFRVFDKEYDVTHKAKQNLYAVLINAYFEMNIHFKNMENIAFTSTILREKGKTFLQEAKTIS